VATGVLCKVVLLLFAHDPILVFEPLGLLAQCTLRMCVSVPIRVTRLLTTGPRAVQRGQFLLPREPELEFLPE